LHESPILRCEFSLDAFKPSSKRFDIDDLLSIPQGQNQEGMDQQGTSSGQKKAASSKEKIMHPVGEGSGARKGHLRTPASPN